MRRRTLVAALAVLLLPGCAAPKKDLSYRDSRLQPPLQIPSGLAQPDYSGQMTIPPATMPAENAPLPDPDAIERPPQVLEQQQQQQP